MSELNKDILQLSAAKRAILELMLRKTHAHAAKLPAITRGAEGEAALLSFAQQRLWFLDQFEPGNPSYNGSAAMRLTGRLDVPAMEHTINEIVRRHEVLRTVFTQDGDGQPRQLVREAMPMALEVTDLSGLPQVEREVEARARIVAEAQRPFDLARGPVLRSSLLKLGAEEHVLLLTMHHIASDAWSAGVFVREMGALYEAYTVGRESPLAELPVQYADYARWQREWLQGEVLEEQLQYWRGQLAGAPPVLEMPTDRPRPARQTFRGERLPFALSPELTERLRELSRREGATLFMTLLAGFAALLGRYSGQAEVVVGTPIAGRTRAEVEGLIGFFVNTLALRADLSGNPSFGALLQRVRETCLGAYQHQEVPFEKLVEELQPKRSLTHTPLFQVMFVFQNSVPERPELAGLRVNLERTDNGGARFDLYLSIEDAGVLRGAFEYSTDLFDAVTIQSLIEHFQTLLAAAVASPERPVSELRLLTEGERRRILVEWNETGVEYPSHLCVHELFEEQAARTPEAVAVVCRETRLSYRELNESANRLAHYLREVGVGPEVLAALMLERSPEMVVALLGVLKSGGAYVPLDPTYPHERLAYMLEDAQASVLLTRGSAAGEWASLGLHVIDLQARWREIEQYPAENAPGVSGPNNLAYLIYTSGSTGRPKGVQIQHGAVVNFLTSMGLQPGISGEDVLAAVTTLSFDIAMLELLLPLTVGGCVALVERETATDGTRLAEKMREVSATVMQATPATWRLLLQSGWKAESHLKILCGGEAWGLDLAEELTRGGAAVWNMYGPTETTIWSMTVSVMQGAQAILIGRPIANTQVYILDRQFEPVPAGVAGELYIGGAGVARGYLNLPALTAERFVPDPFSAELGGRLYRTGDRARHLAAGDIEYLGRSDNQVKLRGYRIELGEVESALCGHASVREAVVVARDERQGDRRLVAYVVEQVGVSIDARELRRYLRERLPEYMVPSGFVLMEDLPLTPNGKVDRRSLPLPEHLAVASGETYVAPRSHVEEMLCGIWAEVLGLSHVGIEDDFFDLGGHSLLATQVTSRLREALRVAVPLRALFELPRISRLAARVEELQRAESSGTTPPPLRRFESSSEPAPLSFAQQRLLFLDQLEPGSAAYNIPGAVRLQGRLEVVAMEQAFNEIVRRHEVLRTVFVAEGGEPRQVVREHLPVALEVTDLSGLPQSERETEARRLIDEEIKRPFDLTHGPVLRSSLLRLGEEEHILLLTMHHIASDGWSAGLLMREVAALYAAYTQGRESPLHELPLQYSDYARWQREWLRGEALERQLTYWRSQLAGDLPVLELPVDRPRPSAQTFRGAHATFNLPEDLVEELRKLSRREEVTLFMLLLAAFQALLHSYSEQSDMILGIDVANRDSTEVEKLIGFFVNQVALRTDLGGNPTFRELLRRVREVCLAAYAHQDVPFEKLVDALRPQRSLAHAPLIQAKLVLGNLNLSGMRMGDLKLTPLEIDNQQAQLDLIVNLVDTGQVLRGRVEYATDLFDATTVDRLWQEFETVLRSAAADPQLPLSALKNILVEAEAQRRADEQARLEAKSLRKLKRIKRRGNSLAR